MKKIPLTQGKFATVDDADFEELMQFKWTYLPSGRGYAVRREMRDGKQVSIPMHRQIMNPPDDKEIDHRDRDGLNNCRSNLRICNHSLNMHNRSVWGLSKYRGVTYDRDRRGENAKRWRARIKFNGKRVQIGRYLTEVEAAKAVDELAVKLWGEDASLNFPKKREAA